MKKCWLVVILSLMMTNLSACRIKVTKVCGTNYPVTYLINRIGQNYVEACNLTNNELIQSASVSDSFIRDLEDADVVFTISQLEPYYTVYEDEFAKSNTKIVDLARTSAIYKFERYTTTVVNNQSVVVESPYYEGDIFNKIDMYDKDLVLWMDPISMMSMAKTIEETLSDLYPENAKDFQNRYNELEIELAKLDAEFQNVKKTGKRVSFVSITPSFGNWQKSYGFDVYPVILSKYGALPTEAQLNEICNRIVQDGVQYIAHEENLTDEMEKLYETVKERCSLTEVNLNNISSISEESIANNKNYMSLMYENLSQIEGMK